LSDFSQIYEEYQVFLSQQREFDSTIAVLSEFQEWRAAVTDTEIALERNDLQAAHNRLKRSNAIIGKLERQTQSIALLSRMKLREDSLTASIKNAFILRWDEMVSLKEGEEGTILSVTEDSNGTTAHT
jgi:CHASE3 domain sensor protein